MPQPDGALMQIAYITKDMDKSLEHWIQTVGAGPFYVLDNLEVENALYRGEPTQSKFTIALGYSGAMCVELIQQHDGAPSVYREVMEQRGEGFHHWGIWYENFDEEVARYESKGYAKAFSGRVVIGGRFAYMDTLKDLGGMVELIEINPAVRDLFGNLEAAAKDWDGADPVRRP